MTISKFKEMSVPDTLRYYFRCTDLDEIANFVTFNYPVNLRDSATWEDVFIRAKELSDVELLLLGLKP